MTFDCTERRINDVMDAIKAISPIVALIKKICVKGTERTVILEKIESDEEDVDTLTNMLSIISNDEMKQELNLILEKFANRVLAKQDKIKQLEAEINAMLQQKEEYLNYADSFHYVATEEIARDLLRKAISEECPLEEFFAILLILKGDCVEDYEEVETIVYEYAEEVKDDYRKHVLKHIEDYDQNDICNLIAEK